MLHTVKRVKRSVNPSLCVKGILLTMYDARTNYNREIAQKIRAAYGADLTVFKTTIPKAIKLAEAGCLGKSVFVHSPHSKVAEAYLSLVKEVQYDG